MTFRQFIILMLAATFSLWLGWWWTVVTIDPTTTSVFGFALFYLTLFLALLGSFTLIGVFIRKARLHEAVLFHLVMLSVRQGVFLATLAVVFLLLQSQRLLSLPMLLLLLAAAFGLEFFVAFREQRRFRFHSKPVADKPANDSLSFEDSVPPQFEKREL